MKIAVLGGGHGAYAAAADLSEKGHEIRLWRRDAAAFAPVLESRAIRVRDVDGVRNASIATPTTDIGVAVRGAQLILVPSPASAQSDIAKAIAPHLAAGQVVFLPPGTFGAYVMDRIARQTGSRAEVTYAETGTLPYLARKRATGEVAITIRAKRLPTGAYPAKRAALARDVIAEAYPAIEPCEDALSAALLNAGPIIHPPLILLNAAPLQHFEHWDIHHEGTQPAVRAVTDALDAERIAVREALDYRPPHFPLSDHYNSDRWMYGDAHQKLVDSGDWREHIDLRQHRYMTEDVVLGLAFLDSVAQWISCEAPVARGLLAVAGAILGRNLRHGPRTLVALSLNTRTPDQLKELLWEGEQ
ncbi:MAG: NAD/NADP octopine/nopaline dehydrogenase family protein [Pseudomonadota bacterium]